jgi:hypothetical protein
MKDIRLDKRLDLAVNKGLAAALLDGIAEGVRIMGRAGVPRNVISRVFLAPTRRRATDWKH